MDDSETRRPSGSEGSHQPETGSESMGDTVRGIVDDLQNIVRDEVQLAKTELKDDARQMGAGAGMIAGGGALGYTGFFFLMIGLTSLIARKLPMWLAATVVGAGLGGAAAYLGMTGRERLRGDRLMPEQTIESVREDAAWASGEVSSVTDRMRSATQ